MKKLILVILAALIVSSCKKEHTCACSVPGVPSFTSETKLYDTKAGAKTSCDNASTTYKAYGGSCSLK